MPHCRLSNQLLLEQIDTEYSDCSTCHRHPDSTLRTVFRNHGSIRIVGNQKTENRCAVIDKVHQDTGKQTAGTVIHPSQCQSDNEGERSLHPVSVYEPENQ